MLCLVMFFTLLNPLVMFGAYALLLVWLGREARARFCDGLVHMSTSIKFSSDIHLTFGRSWFDSVCLHDLRLDQCGQTRKSDIPILKLRG